MTTDTKMNQELLFEIISTALESLYSNDSFLIEHDVNERSVSYRLAMYIQNEIDKKFSGWHVDCEYNRLGNDLVNNHWRSKTLVLPVTKVLTDDVKAKTVYPDINIHHRGEEGEEHNLLVIEVKKSTPKDTHDFKKLEEYGKQLGYQWGIYLNVDPQQVCGYWWEKGVFQSKVDEPASVFYEV